MTNYRKIVAALLVPFLFTTALPNAWADKLSLRTSSPSVAVYDEAAGEFIYTKNANEPVSVASMTKLMTAIVLLESMADLEKEIEISDSDVDRVKFSSSRVPVGAQMSRRDALLLALMSSENRSAHALARTSPYGLRGFVRQMNKTAQRIGAQSANFVDPTGLSPENVASAKDMIRIARYADNFKLIREYSTESKQEFLFGKKAKLFKNTNKVLLYSDHNVVLQKTGFTREAGRCMVIKVTEAGKELFVVVNGALSDKMRTQDALAAIRASLYMQ